MVQQTIRRKYGYGVPGDLSFDGPSRVQTGVIGSTNPANNVVGRVFTQAKAGGVMSADGNLASFGGILVNSKVYPNYGTTGNPLAPSLVVPNGIVGEFMKMGIITMACVAAQAAAPLIDDILQYNIATGEVVTVAAGTTPATGYANVPNGVVYHLPGTAGVGNLFVAKLTN